MAVAGSWFALRRTGIAGRGAEPASSGVLESARLDLRPLAVTRSAEQRAEAAPLVVPRSRVNATIFLPVGSSSGEYEIRILDKETCVRGRPQGGQRRSATTSQLSKPR